jgi:thiol-disulfide isomerase/thioredoxin
VTIKKILAASIILALSAIVFPGCMRIPSESESAIQIGQSAPKFKLPDLSGQMVSLDQFKGKVVLLDFWATWCGPCRMTMPMLEKLQKEFPSSLVLLAINLQEPRDVVRNYVKEQGINSRVLLDEPGDVGTLYGTGSIPMQVFIDKNGIVRLIQMGVKPESQLRAAIHALQAQVR